MKTTADNDLNTTAKHTRGWVASLLMPVSIARWFWRTSFAVGYWLVDLPRRLFYVALGSAVLIAIGATILLVGAHGFLRILY